MRFPTTCHLLVAVLAMACAAPATAARRGNAERGARAASETTADLNAASIGKLPRRIQPTEEDQQPPSKTRDPKSPRAADLGVSSRAPIVETALVSPLDFAGPTLSDAGAYPPDTQGAVGPTQYIAMINGRIRTYSKLTGAADGVLNADTDAFFNSVMTPIAGNFTTDPHIRYDRLSGRWIAVMIDAPDQGNATNRIMVAVSGSSTITAGTTWRFFAFSAPAGEFADYPTLGVDANALYIGTNEFSFAGDFLNSNIYVVRKSSILADGPIVYTAFPNVISNTIGPYTPQGVDNLAPDATTGYVVGIDGLQLGQVDVVRVTNPASNTPTLSSSLGVVVPGTQLPKDVPYLGQGNDNPLDALDDRLFAAQLRNGHLWTAHNVGVTSAGTSPVSPATVTRTASRWYDIDVSGTPTLSNSGTVYDPAASSPRSYWIPTVAVNGQGTMAIGGSTAGLGARPDAWFSSLQPGDPALAAPTIYTSASAGYAPSYADHTAHPGQANRWGDYSLVSVDPNDDQTMWTIQEYVTSTNTWGTRVAKLRAPAPATPTSASAPTVPRGAASVHVTITGPAGAGWFDPGAGFANRLALALSCGATVNAITVNSPSSLDVDLNTQSASKVACNVTLTNPDGQTAPTALGLFTTDSQPVAHSDRYAIPNGTPYNGTGLLANDTDADDASLIAAKASDPAHGTVTVNSDGSFTYAPDGAYAAGNPHYTDSFTYTASDGLFTTAPATVTLRAINPSLNSAPAGTHDDVTIPHSATATGNVLANDTDGDGDPMYANRLSDPQHGTLTMGSDGTFSYTTTGRYQGTDSFTYAASDGIAASNPVTVTLTGPADAAPVAHADAYSTGQDQALDGSSVLANDTDADGDSLGSQLASSPAHGTLTLAPNGTFHYVPESGFSGTDSFSYRADDGRVTSAATTVTIGVAAPAAPVVTPPTPANGNTVPIAPVTPVTPQTRCVVPKLRGRTLAAARKALTAAHCRVGKVRRVSRASVKHGRVVSSAPRAGRRLAVGAQVALTIRR